MVVSLEVTSERVDPVTLNEVVLSRRERLILGQERARKDVADRSLIFDPGASTLVVLVHSRRARWQLGWPFRLEEIVTAPGDRADLRLVAAAFEVTASSVDQEVVTETVGPWLARKQEIEVELAGARSRLRVEVWNTDELPVDAELYEGLLRAESALDPRSRSWMPRLLDLEGVPVKIRRTAPQNLGDRVVTTEVTAVAVGPGAEAALEPPETYPLAPFDLGALFGVAAAGGGPPAR